MAYHRQLHGEPLHVLGRTGDGTGCAASRTRLDRGSTFVIAISVVRQGRNGLRAISRLLPTGGLLCLWHKEAKAIGGLRFPPASSSPLSRCHAAACHRSVAHWPSGSLTPPPFAIVALSRYRVPLLCCSRGLRFAFSRTAGAHLWPHRRRSPPGPL